MTAAIWSMVAHHWTVLAGGGALAGIAIALVTALGPAAVLGMLKIVPRWCWEVLIVLVLLLAYGLHERGVGERLVQAKWDAANVAQALASKEAIDKRTAYNTLLKTIQLGTSANIQKAHDNEITAINASLAAVKRMRVGPNFCPNTSGQANSDSPSSSDGADTGGRLLSESVDAATKQLILKAEEVAATGRAAQAFIKENGMAPK
jgi:hypothetical protein